MWNCCKWCEIFYVKLLSTPVLVGSSMQFWGQVLTSYLLKESFRNRFDSLLVPFRVDVTLTGHPIESGLTRFLLQSIKKKIYIEHPTFNHFSVATSENLKNYVKKKKKNKKDSVQNKYGATELFETSMRLLHRKEKGGVAFMVELRPHPNSGLSHGNWRNFCSMSRSNLHSGLLPSV